MTITCISTKSEVRHRWGVKSRFRPGEQLRFLTRTEAVEIAFAIDGEVIWLG